MVPQEKLAAVNRGLTEAFGVTEIEDIRKMTKGHAYALVLRIVVRGNPYLLRVILRPNAAIGPEREITCMKLAAEAGLAPRVWYGSAEDGICITDFVEEVPFPDGEALVRIPAALKALHAVAAFPEGVAQFNTTLTFLLGAPADGFVKRFREAHILPEAECEKLLGWYGQVAAAYRRRDADMVSSHNDLFKPDNMLFDGERLWLVDWEAAFLNDRYADLAVVANLVVTNDEEESAFLREYFGRDASEYERARLYVMRQLSHMFYAMGFLLLGSMGGAVDWSLPVPSFEEFRRGMWAGEVDLRERGGEGGVWEGALGEAGGEYEGGSVGGGFEGGGWGLGRS